MDLVCLCLPSAGEEVIGRFITDVMSHLTTVHWFRIRPCFSLDINDQLMRGLLDMTLYKAISVICV